MSVTGVTFLQPFTTLIAVSDLASSLEESALVIFDCRHDLANYESGRQAYAAGHIPGARFLHLDEDLSGPKTGTNGRHPLPHPQTLALRLSALGVNAASQVVAYDASGGCFASRLWWMLRWIGHDRVAVLDGGWDAWKSEGNPISTAAPRPVPGGLTPAPRNALGVNSAYIEENLGQSSMTLIDARSPDRFAGQNETLDPVAGHIPGARNRFFKLNLNPDGRFKPAGTLRSEFSSMLGGQPVDTVIHQCGSGVTACHNLLAMEHAGLSGSRLYPGSWSAWVSNRQRPIET